MNATPTVTSVFVVFSLFLGNLASSYGQDSTPRQPNGSVDVTTADAQAHRVVSDWGRMLRGLQCRATLPRQIELGMVLEAMVEFRIDDDKRPESVKALNPCFDMCTPFSLHCKHADTGARFELEANIRAIGPAPSDDKGRRAIPLDGTAIEPRRAAFTLSRAEPAPESGPYECFVRFTQPEGPTYNWSGTREDWDALGAWTGTIRSHPAPVQLLPESARTRTIFVPKQLRVVRRSYRVCMAAPRPLPEAYLLVTYLPQDAEELTVPVRNGHWMGTIVEADNGSWGFRGGPPEPNDPNGLDQWHQYKGGPRSISYEIRVIETCDDDSWLIGPGSCGYKVLWEKTFHLFFSETELLAVPEE